MLIRPHGHLRPTAAAEGLMASQIGVDEWVAQSGERRDAARGCAARSTQPRRARRLVAAAGAGAARRRRVRPHHRQRQPADGRLHLPAVRDPVAGTQLAAGWAGLLDLGYIAFVGFGAYGYAIFSSTALGSGGTGGVHLPAFASIPSWWSPGGGRRDHRLDRAAAGGRLPGDRDAVRRPGVRGGRQQRRPRDAGRRQRHLRPRLAPRVQRHVSTPRGYYSWR